MRVSKGGWGGQGAGGPDPPPGKSQKYSNRPTGVSLLNGVSLACR